MRTRVVLIKQHGYTERPEPHVVESRYEVTQVAEGAQEWFFDYLGDRTLNTGFILCRPLDSLGRLTYEKEVRVNPALVDKVILEETNW